MIYVARREGAPYTSPDILTHSTPYVEHLQSIEEDQLLNPRADKGSLDPGWTEEEQEECLRAALTPPLLPPTGAVLLAP